MTKPNGKRMKLASMRKQREDALNGRYVEIELPDDAGTVVQILRQPFWAPDLVKTVRSNDVVTNEDMLEVICGEKDWAAIQACELELGDYADIVDEVTKGAPDAGKSGSSSNS